MCRTDLGKVLTNAQNIAAQNCLLRVQEARQQKKKEAKKSDPPPSCFFFGCLSIFLHQKKTHFCRKRLCTVVCLCFVALVNTFPWICSILSTSAARFTHSLNYV